MKKKIGILALAIVIAILVISIIYINTKNEKQENNENFKIVTTFYPVYIMTQNITKNAEGIELVNMTDINVGCLHDYTLIASDMKKIENADVIIQNGLDLENFMDKILKTYSEIKIVDSSKNVTNKTEENGKVNNHIWTSLSNYILQIEEIANNLIKMDEKNKATYEKNKKEYIQKIQELQKKYNEQLADLKAKKAICLNEAVYYIAKEVGLSVTSVETHHEESTISAEKMKELINQMKQENIKIILVDEEDNLKNAQTLSNETGAKIYKLKSGLTGETNINAYINDMEKNLEEFKQMLK